MLWILVPLLLTLAAALLLAAVTRSRFSDHVAPLLFSMLLLLYGFYVFDLLTLGRAVLILLLLGWVFLSLLLLCRNTQGRQQLKAVLFQKGFLFFLTALVFVFLFTAGKKVILFDDLRLWAAYPKILHASGSFQLGKESFLFPSMQSYPPGMPLLCYFFTSFSPVFPEDGLFFLYSFFCLSMLIPFLDSISPQRKWLSWTGFLLLLFLPWFLSSTIEDSAYFYSSLFIDIPLGICCGYMLYHGFRCFDGHTFSGLKFLPSCCCIVLLKDSGSYMALCGVLAAITSLWFCRRHSRKKGFLFLLFAGALVALFWSSWRILLSQLSVSNHLHLQLTVSSLSILARITYRFLTDPVVGLLLPVGTISLSLPFILLFLFTAKFLLCRSCRPKNTARELTETGIQILCYGGFFIGYCFVFLKEIQEGTSPSYSRYMSTLVFSAIFIFAADVLHHYKSFFEKLSDALHRLPAFHSSLSVFFSGLRRILILVSVLSLLLAVFFIRFDRHSPGDAFFDSATRAAQAASDNIPATEEPFTDLFLCTPGSPAVTNHFRHRVYYELLDEKIRVLNFVDDRNILSDQFGFTEDSFLDHLIEEGYDYLLLTWTDPLLQENFGNLFPDEGENILYRVDAQLHQLVRVN